MTQENFIIELFCRVDDMLPKTREHFQAKLSSSELVTLGLLFALKGTSQRAFYRWLKQNWSGLFPSLPERTRLFRRLQTHQQLTAQFLAELTLFGVIDSYGIQIWLCAAASVIWLAFRTSSRGESSRGRYQSG